MRFCLFILTFLITLPVTGQLTPEVQTQLRTELAAQINAMRKEKQLPPLAFDAVLKQAAQLHADYMAQHIVLSHEEEDLKLKSPKNRVVMRGGSDFEFIGENILMLKAPTGKPDLTQCKQIAKDMATMWKKSQPHYENILNKNYTLGDFGFGMDTVAGTIYVTQVFGKRGVIVENQLSVNGFGIVPAESACEDRYESYSNLVYNLGNNVFIEGREVNLYLSDRTLFDKIFPGDTDGLAIDLINKNQFPCAKENMLDISPVYDGILLKPIYRKEMLEGNKAQSNYRFVVKVADIPESVDPKDYRPSIVLLNGKKSCMYLFPVCVPVGEMNLVKYEPELFDPPNITMEKQGIIRSVELTYDFSSNDTVPKQFPMIPQVNGSVSSVYIHSFTSVDGDSTANAFLHQSRARAIQRHLEKKLVLSADQLHIDARENWELMRYQLLYYGLTELKKMPNNRVREHYTEWDAPWKQLFAKQRRSSATINYYGVLPANAPQKLIAETNLRTTLLKGEWDKANKSMAILYKLHDFPAFLFDEPYYAIVKKQPELVQNVSALLTLNPNLYRENIGECIDSWVNYTPKLSPGAKRNLLYLYAVTYNDILKIWDLPSQNLSNVLKPARMIPVKSTVQIKNEELLFNLHLTFIEYYGQINDGKGISTSFDFLVNYVEKEKLSLQKQIELSLFCNHWSRYDLTVSQLSKRFKEGQYNAESVMILLQTMTHYREDFDNDLYQELIKTAVKLAPSDFCTWVNSSFQVKRFPDVKNAFCKTCSSK